MSGGIPQDSAWQPPSDPLHPASREEASKAFRTYWTCLGPDNIDPMMTALEEFLIERRRVAGLDQDLLDMEASG